MNARRSAGHLILVGAIIAVTSAASTTPALGQQQWISYAAKFVCGAENDPDVSIVLGKYRTVVNIHNPHYLVDETGAPAPVEFFKKVVLALPQGERPLKPSCKQGELLFPDEALAVNCTNIRNLLLLSGLPAAGELEGFVVIEVPPQGPDFMRTPLDVVAVYTARHRTGISIDVRDYDVQTMDVEEVLAKDVIGIPAPDPCENPPALD